MGNFLESFLGRKYVFGHSFVAGMLAFALLVLTPFPSTAQDTGYISGTVTDKSGAAVAGADVVVTATRTGA